MSSSLKNALGRSGGKLAGATAAAPEAVARAELVSTPSMPPAAKRQLSRENTAAITVHYPEPVRRQLKILASEEGRTMDDMVAEALNLLFTRYRKPEIAPRKEAK